MYNIGVCHEYGTGVDVDEKEAVRLYKLAAEQQKKEMYVPELTLCA
jgi:TPR repeat protein